MITVCRASTWSYSKWFCLRVLTRNPLGTVTEPELVGCSPERQRRNVVFPVPLAPMSP